MSTLASETASSTVSAPEASATGTTASIWLRLRPVLLAVTFPIALLVVWHLTTAGSPASLIPPPYDVWLELRDLATAVQFGQLAIGADPCWEPAHRLLMRCYAQQHQQQLVSRQYRLCSAALRDELGVSPGADTVQLFHSLISVAYVLLTRSLSCGTKLLCKLIAC